MEYMEYMNWLKNKYGNTNLSGFKLVSEILEDYVYPVNVMKIYKELAEKHNLKYQAVERNISTYKNALLQKDTLPLVREGERYSGITWPAPEPWQPDRRKQRPRCRRQRRSRWRRPG